LTVVSHGATIVETFNNGGAMAIVNYSVPEEVKTQFNRAFARENKSSVIARLMMQAVEERRAQRARARAIDSILRRRRTQKPVSNSQIRATRIAGRP
jgi:hypothetical protein